jgi:hypothetical protein
MALRRGLRVEDEGQICAAGGRSAGIGRRLGSRGVHCALRSDGRSEGGFTRPPSFSGRVREGAGEASAQGHEHLTEDLRDAGFGET